MATSYTSKLNLPKSADTDTAWGTPGRAAMDTLEALSPINALNVGLHEVPSTTLSVKVAAGAFINAAGAYIAFAGNPSLSLSASTTTNVWLTDAGVLTTGAAWPTAGTNHVRLATVTTSGSAVTGITDQRTPFRSASS